MGKLETSVGLMRRLRHNIWLGFVTLSNIFGFSAPARFATEIVVLLVLCLTAAAWSIYLFSQFEFVRVCHGFDFWFDSDPARTVANITSRWSSFHARAFIHPLYSLFVAAPFAILGKAFALSTSTLVALYVGLQSACYAGAAYTAMRMFGLVRFDAALGLMLLYSTAAAIYWIGFPEWVAFGAIAALLSTIWVAGPAAIRNHVTGVGQNLLSASMVVTGWPIGAAASIAADWPKLRWGRAYAHTRDALALMAVLTVIQYLVVPTAGRFLGIWGEIHDALYGDHPYRVERSLVGATIEFLGQTLLAPHAAVVAGPRNVPGWGILIMTGQGQAVPATLLTLTALALWSILWVLGLLAAFRGGLSRAAAIFVVGALLYFYVLHMLFGGEIFLFSLHFAPFLAFIAIWGVRSRQKAIVRALCIALIATSLAHNYPTFRSAVATHNAIDLSWLARVSTASDEVAKTDCR